MVFANQFTPIYSYFTENHVSANQSTEICEVADELLRLSKIMFQTYGWAEVLPSNEIRFLAEIILQMGAHGIPGFDPRRISDEQYKIMYEATYSLVHTVLRNPTMSMEKALQKPLGTTQRAMRVTRTRLALLNVLNDRRRGVVVNLSLD